MFFKINHIFNIDTTTFTCILKKLLLIFFSLSYYFVVGQNVGSYYTFVSSPTVAYVALGAGATTVHVGGVDDAISGAIAIPFTFNYGCVTQPSLVISSNGWISFNTSTLATNPGTITGGPSRTNDLDNITNNFTTPNIIAPFWDDLSTTDQAGTANDGFVRYLNTGVTPNQIFKIEWFKMEWTPAGTTNAVISCQVWLYENGNRIEFRYKQEAAAAAGAIGASIGLMGATTGDFISITQSNTLTPTSSNAVEDFTVNNKPRVNALYTFSPVACSGVPTSGTAKATPSLSCSDYTTSLSLTGNSGGCNTTYLWYHCNTAGGTYTAIGTPTSVPTQTFAIVTGTPKFFKCDVACGASTVTTGTITALVGPGGAGVGSFSLAPFTSTTIKDRKSVV